ncbi:MAG: transmembrane domain-containing protein, partial [Trueperaceae bacterium]
LPEHPTGPSFDLFDGANVWPRRTPLGRFEANVAHSNGSVGLHVDNGPTADLSGVPPTWYRPRSVPSNPDSPPVLAVFDDFVAYKHRRAAAWFRGDHAVLRGGVLADNAIGVTFASRTSWAEGVAFVGETSNVGSPRSWEATGTGGRALPRYWDPSFAIRGFEFYDGDVAVRDSTFVAFTSDDIRPASALTYLDFTAFAVSPRNAAQNLSFGPGTNRVHLASRAPEDGQPADGYRSAVFVDVDGSVSGTAGRTVTVNTAFLSAPGCQLRTDWNAYVCPGRYAALTLEDVRGTGGFAPVAVTRDDGPTHVLLGTPSAHRSFRSVVRLDRDHGFTHAGHSDHVRVHLHDVEAGDAMLVSLPWPSPSPHVYRDWWIDDRNLLPTHASLAALVSSAGTGTFHDGTTLHVRLVVQDGRGYAQVEVCALRGCP